MENAQLSTETAVDWIEFVSVGGDLALIVIAAVSLWIASMALRHQRAHDTKMIEHELIMAKPQVVWEFGMTDGFLHIGLMNFGPGRAIRIRSELIFKGELRTKWKWQEVVDEIRRGHGYEIKDVRTTMPQSMNSDQQVKFLSISVAKTDPVEVLRRLIETMEIRYFYKSALDDEELVTDWATSKSMGFTD